MKIALKVDRFGHVSYITYRVPNVPVVYHAIIDMPSDMRSVAHNEVHAYCRCKGGMSLRVGTRHQHFGDKALDFLWDDNLPQSVIDSAANLSRLYTHTTYGGFWYTMCTVTGALQCVGRVGGPRGDGRGINYRDRAVKRAEDQTERMLSFYRTAGVL